MGKRFIFFLPIAFFFFLTTNGADPSDRSEEGRVFGIVQRMESVFKELKDYTCEVEQIFCRDGGEDQHYRFKFYFKKQKKIRVDFSYPYSSLSLFYEGGDKEATVLPFRHLPGIKFRFSVGNSMIKTMAGQQIDQTDMGYFIEFLSKNLKKIPQRDEQIEEDAGKVTFSLEAMDYIEEKSLERYKITVSKENWLPIHIERYKLDGKPLEMTDIKNYTVNGRLQDKLFIP
jgi:outer membrane lipoprotein-sorting protein